MTKSDSPRPTSCSDTTRDVAVSTTEMLPLRWLATSRVVPSLKNASATGWRWRVASDWEDEPSAAMPRPETNKAANPSQAAVAGRFDERSNVIASATEQGPPNKAHVGLYEEDLNFSRSSAAAFFRTSSFSLTSRGEGPGGRLPPRGSRTK